MWIKKQHPWDLPESEITDHKTYLNRRKFIEGSIGLAALSVMPFGKINAARGEDFAKLSSSEFSTDERLTSFESITTYNNFYEFGTDKSSPSALAADFPDPAKPWQITVDGECDNPGVFDYQEFIQPYTLEERIYRLRCVEGWSMVIPWVGFQLSEVLKKAQPNSRAKFVEFTTLYDPQQMPGQRRRILQWPYKEGLRIDEAMHPLTILAVGLYGKLMPGQNGAPIRLVVPWKYGFKSIKSIVRIRFTEQMPLTAWVESAPHEYGFYSNVNPEVNHPRWSQRRERRIGELLKRETLMFNGYGEYVAQMYSGMDLRTYF